MLCKCGAVESLNSSEQQTGRGEDRLFLGFKDWLMHLICDRKLSLAGMYKEQKKALEEKVQEEKPVAEQESSRPKT